VARSGLRLQLFGMLAIAIIATALSAALVGYHLFDRELERALEARLRMLVAETARVMDAGIAAGLELEGPQLQERALGNLLLNLATDEVIAVVDSGGRIVASTNPAEIGELLPLQVLAPLASVQPAPTAERQLVIRPIQSLFGAPAGYVTARVGPRALDEARSAFVAKVSLTTAGVTFLGLLAAAAGAFWLPWQAWRVASRIERHMEALYRGIGTQAPPPAVPNGLPINTRRSLERFTLAVEARESELRARASAVDALDEAA
jgi:hypothetical protein